MLQHEVLEDFICLLHKWIWLRVIVLFVLPSDGMSYNVLYISDLGLGNLAIGHRWSRVSNDSLGNYSSSLMLLKSLKISI